MNRDSQVRMRICENYSLTELMNLRRRSDDERGFEKNDSFKRQESKKNVHSRFHNPAATVFSAEHLGEQLKVNARVTSIKVNVVLTM